MRNPFRRRQAAESFEAQPKAMIEVPPWWDLTLEPFGFPLFQTSIVGERLQVAPGFAGLVEGALKRSPVIFACILARQQLFSEARFQFRRYQNGRPGDMFGTPALKPLEEPWPGGTTGDLLALAEAYNSTAGNFFAVRDGDFIRPLRPDWMTIALDVPEGGSVWDSATKVLGYLYAPPDRSEPEMFLPEEMCHWMPCPDPEFPWRGMSWLSPVIDELLADREMTKHLRKYLEGGATPNLAVKLDVDTVQKFEEWVAKHDELRERRAGNPYRTLWLGGAATPIPLGHDLKAVDFAEVQAGKEVRIATAAGVHPSLIGLTAGLKGSSLNAGNLQELRRQFADLTISPLWRTFAGAMSRIIDLPPANADGSEAELCADLRDVRALAEDAKDRADTLQVEATTIASLITAGFDPDTAVQAVVTGDLRLLEHTGLVSVQLNPPGSEPAPAPNGNGNGRLPALTP